YIARNRNQPIDPENHPTKNGSNHQKPMIGTIFQFIWLVMSQPRFFHIAIIYEWIKSNRFEKFHKSCFSLPKYLYSYPILNNMKEHK
ncbi:hypothetical protein, partial [Oceanobacillus profundus]|uniref:hypothetical protein n=1 Tax=Oceanobacillus profundus TaxID=372463 RepID=UPI003642129F